MVRRTSDLIGRPVVSGDSGKKLGTITDLLVDDSEGRLVGLVLQHGWMKSEEVLPAAAVQTLGTDAVVANAGTWIHMPAQLPHSIRTKTSVVMLLLLLKQQQAA